MLGFTRIMMVAALTGFVTVACSTGPTADGEASSAPLLTACEDPRPEICTAHYEPVCGSTGSDGFKTYANACAACSNKAVSGHRPGACE